MPEDYDASKHYKVTKQVQSTRIGNVFLVDKEVNFPAYIPEIKSGEDLKAVMNYEQHFPETWPISISSSHFRQVFESMPEMHTDESVQIQNLLLNRHFIFYEPNELYRYTMPLTLVSHVFAGNISRTRRFWRYALTENNKAKALNMLPPFERKFIEAEWPHTIYHKYNDCSEKRQESIKKPDKPTDWPHLERVWHQINDEYFDKILRGLKEADNVPSASYIPPTPRLVASSDKSERERVVMMNRATSFLWKNRADTDAMPWLSLYVDQSCFTRDTFDGDQTGPDELQKVIQDSFSSRAHVGISITISGWEQIKESDSAKRKLIYFMKDAADYASQYGAPLYLPRGGYYAFEMIDHGAAFFGSLLNGNEKYSKKRGGPADADMRYGKLAVYRSGNWSFDKVKRFLRDESNEFPPVPGLPNRPYPHDLKKAKRFRINYSKPMRIGIHTREVNELINAVKNNGTLNPALRYLETISEQKYY